MFVLLFAAVILLSSCSVEKKLGKEYREMSPDTIALLLMPDYLFKYNLKTYESPGIDSLPEWQRDSILIANSLFLSQLNDSSVLAGFGDNFAARLSRYRIKVIREQSLDSFFVMHHSGLVINIAQISLEEYVHPYSFDYAEEFEEYTIGGIDLNALNINVWVEISQLNSEQKNKVLFASNSIADQLDGYFRQYLFTGNTEFEYTVDTMNLQQVNTFTDEMGTTCAMYLYDYLLNSYIRKRVPENYPYDIRPLRWDPEKSLFEFIEPEDLYIELEPQK
jgi:hypothetical protein